MSRFDEIIKENESFSRCVCCGRFSHLFFFQLNGNCFFSFLSFFLSFFWRIIFFPLLQLLHQLLNESHATRGSTYSISSTAKWTCFYWINSNANQLTGNSSIYSSSIFNVKNVFGWKTKKWKIFLWNVLIDVFICEH